ncbi:hypothetical protein [Polaromonas aquatica]|uniref:Flagellar transcriptional regulator FlhC n=1 Tax=Polaromonas aquatica TaxID=332657 RepID=A0ABW1TV90_9BURK
MKSKDQEVFKIMRSVNQATANKVATGKATASKSRINLFDDPRWEDRFDVLIRLTQRTQLIKDLTGTDLRPQRIKAAIDKRLEEMGVEIQRPRGSGQTYTAKGFLYKMSDKYEAAYLLGLHFGANGPGSQAAFDTSLGNALDKRMETYLRYCSDMHERTEDASISFETYIVLIEGIKNHEVPIHTCKDCSTTYCWPVGSYVRHSCPVCAVHQLDVKAAKQKLDAMLNAKKINAAPVRSHLSGGKSGEPT